jgi:peptidyl-prolyl cis-trans isomerase SurA
MQYMKRLVPVFIFILGFSAVAGAQAQRVIADKIAAIVGDRIILRSDVVNSIADIARQGGQIPDNAECYIMEQAIISKVAASTMFLVPEIVVD